MSKSKSVLWAMTLGLLLSACSNRYNGMVDWVGHIPIGTMIDTVRMSQPDYVEIAWDKPDTTSDSLVLYSITRIKWCWDPLHMDNKLAFKNNRYVSCWAHK